MTITKGGGGPQRIGRRLKLLDFSHPQNLSPYYPSRDIPPILLTIFSHLYVPPGLVGI